jgi:hypothetical protein
VARVEESALMVAEGILSIAAIVSSWFFRLPSRSLSLRARAVFEARSLLTLPCCAITLAPIFHN